MRTKDASTKGCDTEQLYMKRYWCVTLIKEKIKKQLRWFRHIQRILLEEALIRRVIVFSLVKKERPRRQLD